MNNETRNSWIAALEDAANKFDGTTGYNWTAADGYANAFDIASELRYMATEVPLADLIDQKKWFAVTGRIPGADEDSLYVFNVSTREEALAAFERDIYEDETNPEETRGIVFNDTGVFVFVNSIVCSDSPITDLG